MKLEDFIFQSLTAITAAVQSAQEKSKVKIPQTGWDSDHPLPPGFTLTHNRERMVSVVEFDIAIIVDTQEEIKTGLAAALTVVGFGVQAKIKDAETSASRIRFSLPVDFSPEDGGNIKDDGIE